MSRIDRIYMEESIYPYGYNWQHEPSAGISDHELVLVDILKSKLPYIGDGLWRMHKDDIEDNNCRNDIRRLLRGLQDKMIKEKNNNTTQEQWLEAKDKIKKIVTETRILRKRTLNKEKNALERIIQEKLKQLAKANEENKIKHARELSKAKINLAKRTRIDIEKIQEATRARYRLKGEKCTKYWFGLNKEKWNEQTILALKDKDNKLCTETKEMITIATRYHEALQSRPPMNQDRTTAIEKMANAVQKDKITVELKQELETETSREEIKEAIQKTANGTSPGIDGIPYELYKELIKTHENAEEPEKEPDIIEILYRVIKSIEDNGIIKRTKNGKHKPEFTDGVMCLIYKKKEKWKIENYRPITLLNTDYKIYTKTIAEKLAKVAGLTIHEDQAGFIPKRSIYDHTKTTQLTVELCELTNRNGCIIALDQEKAYDKIDHTYLWRILEANGIPEKFINKIKELYKDTGKSILINGIISEQYKVERGVHQGDPMSCLLYNIAIEPLAQEIRGSKLKGIEINEKTPNLIVNLFADDTLVYISETDDVKELEVKINSFCKASTAKFNEEKTEYLPVGHPKYREEVIRNRKIGEYIINEKEKIIKEGESMRTLGSWVGNKKNDNMQWDKIIKAQEKIIDMWSNTNLTYKGKEIILKSLVQSKANYLATVNGMPKDIEEKMKKIYKEFIWNKKDRGLMQWNQIIAPRDQGGLGIPDIRSRVEAIEIMWIKKWLSPNENKPKWTHIMDEILKRNIAKTPMIDYSSRITWIQQLWHESEAKDSKISKTIKNMLRVARKFNITITAPKFSKETKEQMPLWHNVWMQKANYQWNKKASRCLRANHEIITIGDLFNGENTERCMKKSCDEMITRLRELVPKLINPTETTPTKVKKNLDLSHRTIRKLKKLNKKIFNPDITAKGNPLEQVRIFNKGKGMKTRKAIITPHQPAYRDETVSEGRTKAIITIIIKDNGKPQESILTEIKINGSTKSKIKYKNTGENPNKNRARAAAILWILEKTKGKPLTIVTRDKWTINWIGGGINDSEDNAWVGAPERELWKRVLIKLRKRNQRIKIRKPNSKREESIIKNQTKKLKNAKNELKELKLKETANQSKGRTFLNEGARLAKLNQNTAYKLALEENMKSPGGIITKVNMKLIKKDMEEEWEMKLTETNIWESLEKIEQPEIAQFIWKLIHGRIKCGKFFRFIPEWTDKEFCRCGETESMKHILIECKESGQEDLWEMIANLWKTKMKTTFRKPKIGTIMALGAIKMRKGEQQKSNIYSTIIAITSWTIWKNRNKRIFEGEMETKDKQIETWKQAMRKEHRTKTLVDEMKNKEKSQRGKKNKIK